MKKLIEYINLLCKNKTSRQYSLLLFSNFCSIAISFILNLVITRLLNVSQFGEYKYIVSIISMFTAFFNFGIYYSSARLLISKKNNSQIYGATLLLNFFIYVTVVILVFLMKLLLGDAMNDSFMYGAVLLFTLFFQRTFTYMLRGTNKIKDIAFQTLAPNAIAVIIYFVLLIFYSNTASLFIVLLIYGASYLLADLLTIKRIKAVLNKDSLDYVKLILKEQRDNGFQIYKGSLFSVFTGDLLNVIVGSLVGSMEYAFYSLAVSLSTMITQIPSIMGVISFKKNAELSYIEKKDIKVTFLLTGFFLICIFITIHVLFPFVYDKEYLPALSYLFWLLLTYSFYGLGDYFNSFLSAHGEGVRIKRCAYYSGIVLIVLAVCLVPTFKIWGLTMTRLISSIVYCGLLIIEYRKYIRRELNNDEIK